MTDNHREAAVSIAGPAALGEAQRRRQGVRAALGSLERAIAAPTTGREGAWVARVADELIAVQTAFGYHVTVTEGADGLFAEIMSDAPRLAHQIELLRSDHQKISRAIDSIIQLTAGPAAEGRLSEIGEAALDLLAKLTRHRHLGSTLVYEAYSVDIDAAD